MIHFLLTYPHSSVPDGKDEMITRISNSGKILVLTLNQRHIMKLRKIKDVISILRQSLRLEHFCKKSPIINGTGFIKFYVRWI